MARFVKDKTATFKFHPNGGTATEYLTLKGINASVTSADTITQGVTKLMYIGGNYPAYNNATRTTTEKVVVN